MGAALSLEILLIQLDMAPSCGTVPLLSRRCTKPSSHPLHLKIFFASCSKIPAKVCTGSCMASEGKAAVSSPM